MIIVNSFTSIIYWQNSVIKYETGIQRASETHLSEAEYFGRK
jgi:hypothetical protein